jgi:hypothetical protein
MLGLLAGALTFVALAVPSSALAQGTYTWNLASDFTSTAPGANPDHDPYGATPWSYVEGASSTSLPSTFTLLPTFATGVDNGLAAWSTGTPGTPPLVGINPMASPITISNGGGGIDTFPPGQIVLQPGASSQEVAVGWTSPLSQTETIQVNGSFSADSSAVPVCTDTTWSIIDQNGTVLASNTTGTTDTFPTLAPTIGPGESIYVTVSTPDPVDAACDATGLILNIQAPGVAPTVSLTDPASGTSTTLAEPTLSGAADAGFGDSGQVAVLIYSGGTASGAPLQTATVARSGTTWSATLTSPLPLGTYTAQAEQADVVGDLGVSSPVTFTVATPLVSLTSPGSALPSSTPVLSGTAGTAPDENSFVAIVIYRGSTASGSPSGAVSAPVSPSGQFSVQVTPALADGTYTAVATQGDTSGTIGISASQTFGIDTQAPAVTLVRPTKGGRSDVLQLVFSGAAATQPFDSGVVSVAVYKGTKASGKRYRTLTANVKGSAWSATWTGKLPPARYTVQASQTDAVGHVGRSAAHTFRVLALPPVIGGVTINKAGRVTLKVTCNEPAGDTCSGNVLVLTRGYFQTLPGGPAGHLTVMFAYVKVGGSLTSTIVRNVQPRVAGALRRRAAVPVVISATLHPVSGKAIRSTARENLRRL